MSTSFSSGYGMASASSGMRLVLTRTQLANVPRSASNQASTSRTATLKHIPVAGSGSASATRAGAHSGFWPRSTNANQIAPRRAPSLNPRIRPRMWGRPFFPYTFPSSAPQCLTNRRTTASSRFPSTARSPLLGSLRPPRYLPCIEGELARVGRARLGHDHITEWDPSIHQHAEVWHVNYPSNPCPILFGLQH